MNLIDQAKNFARGVSIITDWLGSGGHCVDQTLAQSRASTCLQCHKNMGAVPLLGKAAEIVKEQIELKNNLKLRVIGEKGLGQCSVCSCILKLKVWVPIRRIMPQPEDKFPDHCWVLHESKQA